MSSLKEVIDNIKNAADDLATLQVTTFTGTLTTTVAPDGQIKWDELRKGSAATSGDLTLVAATKVYADYDVDYYQTSKDVVDREEMLKAHLETVKASAEARLAFIKLVANAAGLKV